MTQIDRILRAVLRLAGAVPPPPARPAPPDPLGPDAGPESAPPTIGAGARGWGRLRGSARGRRMIGMGLGLGLAVIGVGVVLLGRGAAPTAADRLAWEGEDELLQVLASYCAAETVAGMTLDPRVLDPYVVADGPWQRRRAQALRARAAAGRPHTARMQAWQVRHVARVGQSATVVTVELWENREAGAPSAAQAFVQATYDLRWEGDTWRIWDIRLSAWTP
jgi:hypothetical protein